MFGKGYEDLYLKAQKDYGIRFIRGRVSEVAENIDKQLVIKAEDTLSGKPVKVTLDLLVLMAGMKNCVSSSKISNLFSLKTDEYGFLPVKTAYINYRTATKKEFSMQVHAVDPKHCRNHCMKQELRH